LFLPLFKTLEQSPRARRVAEKILRWFPGLKKQLVKLLYANGSATSASLSQTLHTGHQQQRVYEELKRRLESQLK